ncbi:MAG: DUF6152 family protein [Steroidobacteraceae bacterium]
MKRSLLAAGVAALLCTGATFGHHSPAAFDRSNPLIVAGTVEQFKWVNPHSWIFLQVPNGKGGNDKWTLEGGSTSVMVRNGWKSNSLQKGQKVKALIAPNRDGSNGGELLSVTFEDGKVLAFGTI